MRLITKLIFLLSFNSIIYASEVNTDSTIINAKIEKALEVIKKDFIFQHYLESEFGKVTTFFISDTLYCPFISTWHIRQFYPDSSFNFILKKYNQYWECYTKYEISPIVKISCIYRDTNSNYSLSIGIMDLNSLSFLIFPVKPKSESRTCQVFVIFDEKNCVLKYYSEQYIVSK
jgi:hypothetical protein